MQNAQERRDSWLTVARDGRVSESRGEDLSVSRQIPPLHGSAARATYANVGLESGAGRETATVQDAAELRREGSDLGRDLLGYIA